MTYRKIVALLLLTIALAGCAKYKQEIWLYPDGSAKLHGELGIESGQIPGKLPTHPFKSGREDTDPNIVSSEFNMYEANGYQIYYADIKLKDFTEFLKSGNFGATQLTQETDAAGNTILTISSPADPQLSALFNNRSQRANRVGEDVTILVHAPSVLETNGEIIAQDAVSTTVQWQAPVAEALTDLNALSFSVEYSFESSDVLPTATPTQKKVASSENTRNQAKATPIATPTIKASAANSASQGNNSEELLPDSDGDWLSDQQEMEANSNPMAVDSDDDRLTDFEELQIFRSDPTKAEVDTDGDGFANNIETELFGTDPAKADIDRDGDLVPDSVEEKTGSNPDAVDADGDLLSDLLELYLLESDANEANPDEDADGFPDILERWLPDSVAKSTCAVDVAFQIDEILVNDPEEADTTSITGGDETFMLYVSGASKDGDFYGTTQENDAGDPNYIGESVEWQGEGFGNSRFTDFQSLGPISVPCGYQGYYGVRMIEDDSPFGGQTDMGLLLEATPILFQRIPVGWNGSKQDVHHFEGTGIDGSFDYELRYTWRVGVTAKPNTDIEQSATAAAVSDTLQESSLAVARSDEAPDAKIVELLPEAFLSENNRLALRYQSSWQIEKPRPGYIPYNYTILLGELTSEQETKITIYDPVHIIEMVSVEDYEELSDAEMLEAFIKKSISMSTTVQPKDLTELQLIDKSITIWQPSTKQQTTAPGVWIAARALDDNLNLIHFEMSVKEFEAQLTLWLTFASLVDYQAPSRRLGEIEKNLRKYMAATATGDLETMKTTLCRRNLQTNDMAGALFGGLFGLDPDATAGATMNFSSGMVELDTSKLFYETLQVSGGSAEVMISGVVSLNAGNGRQTVPFRQYNMIGRNLYRMQQENGQWLLCD